MSRRPVVLAVLLSLSLLLAACSDDDATPGADAGADATPPAVTIETFCAESSERVCAGLSACGCRFNLRPYDAASCVADRTASCLDGLDPMLVAELAAGRVIVHEASLDRCLALLEQGAADCYLPRGNVIQAACASNVVATVALGDACPVAFQGIFCGDALGVCSGQPLTCVALPAEGDDCPDQTCQLGLFCGMDSKCTAPLGQGASCTASFQCQPELVCGDGSCGPRRADGASCIEDDDCQVGHRCGGTGMCETATALGDACSGATCGSDRGCGRAPETRTCGDPDGIGAMCMDSTCADGLGCAAADMMCVALPGTGETCLDGFACAAGLSCVDGVGECQPLPGLGQTCAVGNRFCQDGLGCDQMDNTCKLGPGLGEACLLNPPDYVCAAGLGCDFGMSGSICIAIGGAGSPCNSDRTCAAETYCEFSELFCRARRADGEPCEDGNECLAGSECALHPDGYRCAALPVRDEPCSFDCADDLTCKGPGGECVPEFCGQP